MPEKHTIRCAIYTRKSTEEGLNQAFNSLDAQREAGEAYVAAMKGEGWTFLPDRYDDGGYTGGNMERPALKRLLADVAAGEVDCIVVYKVDRLSRSLKDFSKIVDLLDQHKVTFVSVTQHFNTQDSMGRLTLNILLSFAQFEREIISERTRDKIAATRRKGKWSGGYPVLGYDMDPKRPRLVVNEAEAARVRAIFDLYTENQSLIETIKAADARGWTMKRWTAKDGRDHGGRPLSKSYLLRLLRNVLYLGKITLGKEVFQGEHPAIVDAEAFQKVQALLNRNGRTGGSHVRGGLGALLKGLLRCAPCNAAMTPSNTLKGNRRYRYYICLTAQKRGWHNCPSRSVPAGEIEKFVVDQIREIGRDPGLVAGTIREAKAQAEKRGRELKAEEAALVRDLARANADLRRLAARGNRNGGVADRLADLQERIRVAEHRAAEVREDLVAASRGLVDEEEAARALARFDPVWDSLAPREQARVLHLLVERVDYDGGKNTVSVTFRPSGIRALSDVPAGSQAGGPAGAQAKDAAKEGPPAARQATEAKRREAV